MSRFLRISILLTALILIIACSIPSCGPDQTNNIINGTPTVLSLAKQPQTTSYNAVGQTITYNYLVTNTGTSRLAGPVTIADSKMVVVTCPNLNTVGNKDGNLDGGESIVCSGGYVITQADITAGAVTNTATATVGGVTSNTASATVKAQLAPLLTLQVSAQPNSYTQANQKITFTYTITNTSQNPLGPAQFVVSDTRFQSPIMCGSNTTSIPAGQSIACSQDYTTTTNDASQSQSASTATASGASATTVQPVNVVITNPTVPNNGTPAANVTPGTTIRVTVATGDWLLQLSRCFGANYDTVRAANPQFPDPDQIYPFTPVTIPNVGSSGPIYGPPCVVFYTVVSGDTWQAIANKYNADIDIMIAANPGKTVTAGVQLKIPVNSKKTGTPYPTAIPPTSIPPTAIPPTQGTPIRLVFPAGNPASVNQGGNIGTPATISYVFSANAGQTLSVQLSTQTNDVGLGIYGPNNSILKQPDTANSYSGNLTLTGDYYINLVSSYGIPSKQYSLTVTLSTPVTQPPVTQPPVTNAEMVSDSIMPGSGSSNPSYLSPFSGQLYFQATGNNNAGAELWRYDQASNAVSFASDVNPGPTGGTPAYIRPYNNLLYFSANGDSAGTEVWRYNLSNSGRVNDIWSGPDSSNPSYMTEFNGELYFSANGNNNAGVELWKLKSAADQSTQSIMAYDVNPGPGSSNPSYLCVYNGALYFAATTTNGGTELWKFNGTTATIAADIVPGAGNGAPAFLSVYNNLLYFGADGNNGAGNELWKFDGTNATMAADINPGPNGSAPTFMTPFGTALFFSANGNNAGFELWKFDGTNATMAADINPAGSAEPKYLAVYNNQLYFQATGNNGAGTELWRYKGQ